MLKLYLTDRTIRSFYTHSVFLLGEFFIWYFRSWLCGNVLGKCTTPIFFNWQKLWKYAIIPIAHLDMCKCSYDCRKVKRPWNIENSQTSIRKWQPPRTPCSRQIRHFWANCKRWQNRSGRLRQSVRWSCWQVPLVRERPLRHFCWNGFWITGVWKRIRFPWTISFPLWPHSSGNCLPRASWIWNRRHG